MTAPDPNAGPPAPPAGRPDTLPAPDPAGPATTPRPDPGTCAMFYCRRQLFDTCLNCRNYTGPPSLFDPAPIPNTWPSTCAYFDPFSLADHICHATTKGPP